MEMQLELKLREQERRERLASAKNAGKYLAGWLNAVSLKKESGELIDGAGKQLACIAGLFFQIYRERRKPFLGPFLPMTEGASFSFFTQTKIERFLNAMPLELRVDIDAKGPPIKLTPQSPGLGGTAFGDYQDAFMALLKLSEESCLDRLRQCEWRLCEHWLYAKRSDRRFCDAAGHRDAWHSKSLEDKKKRAEDARKRRQSEKALAQQRADRDKDWAVVDKAHRLQQQAATKKLFEGN